MSQGERVVAAPDITRTTRWTIAEQIAFAGGRSSGFDYMRIILATLVALDHIPTVTYGSADRFLDTFHLRPFESAILPMFFALSGYLVAGSLERCRTLSAFLGLRMIRIFPALAVEVVLSALAMGPLMTTLPLGEYLDSPAFHAYFLNLFGIVHFVLPGVFEHNPKPILVNAQLWTVPYELLSYVTLAILAVVGLKRWNAAAPVAAVGLIVACILYSGMKSHWALDAAALRPDARSGAMLVAAFLAGVGVYLFRDWVPWNRWLFWACAAASAAALFSVSYVSLAAIFPLTYCVVFLGLTNISRAWFLKGADYSYGVFLYHWSILQVVMTYFPHTWPYGLLIGMPLVIAFAAFSWHVVEKPAMEMRRPLMKADGGGPNSPLWVGNGVAALVLLVVVGYDAQKLMSLHH